MPGLLQCSSISEQWCAIKLVQVILSAILACACLAEIIITIQKQGAFILNTRFFIELFMVFSLIFSIAHNIDGSQNLSILLFLQLFFANLFLLTIFFYVGDNTLKSQPARIALYLFYGAMIIFYLVILILRKVYQLYCVQLKMMYMIVDCISVLISIMIFTLYCMRSVEESKMQLFYNQNLVSLESSPKTGVNFHSPFCRMWILITANIICGLVNMVQTVYLYASQKCKFTQDMNTNALINFMLLLFDYYLGSIVTLLVLRKIRIMETQQTQMQIQITRSQSFCNQISEPNKLQLIVNMSSRSSNF